MKRKKKKNNIGVEININEISTKIESRKESGINPENKIEIEDGKENNPTIDNKTKIKDNKINKQINYDKGLWVRELEE